jgi:hypothetical protein
VQRVMPLLMAALVAGLAAPAVHAEATAAAQKLTVPFSTIIGDNPCTGEPAAVEGELVILVRTTMDASGGLHTGIVLRAAEVTAIGLESGEAYVYKAVTTSSFQLSGPPQNELTEAFTTTLVSPGTGGNLVISGIFHETVAATGEVTAFVDDVDAMCTG